MLGPGMHHDGVRAYLSSVGNKKASLSLHPRYQAADPTAQRGGAAGPAPESFGRGKSRTTAMAGAAARPAEEPAPPRRAGAVLVP